MRTLQIDEVQFSTGKCLFTPKTIVPKSSILDVAFTSNGYNGGQITIALVEGERLTISCTEIQATAFIDRMRRVLWS